VVTALKYTISDQLQPIDTLLHSCIGEFLATIGDADLVSGMGGGGGIVSMEGRVEGGRM